MSTQDIVQKLWNLCHILRDDGVSYQNYVTELTQLLFLKMSEEVGKEERIPDGCRWAELVKLARHSSSTTAPRSWSWATPTTRW